MYSKSVFDFRSETVIENRKNETFGPRLKANHKASGELCDLFFASSSKLTQVLHFAFGIGLEMAGLLRSIDSYDRFDLTQSLDMHDMVLDLLPLINDSI